MGGRFEAIIPVEDQFPDPDFDRVVPVDLAAALASMPPEPWRCHNTLCLDGSRWWLSIHGAINCRNCCPPSLEGIVAGTGTLADAPLVHPSRLTTPLSAVKGSR